MDATSAGNEVISLQQVTKEYYLLTGKNRLWHIFQQGLGFNTHALHDAAMTVQAVNDVSLTIPKGQIVGIIGHNGAGKSTLLRLLAGLSKPTRGKITVNGRVSAMLTLGAGLNPELTGRKNIFTSGIYQGYTIKEIRDQLASIIAFADIGEFIDHPVRTYSSGMQARLAFAIMTGFDFADILLIDEALGAGDARFGMKSFARIRERITQGRTVVLVSHSLPTVQSLCHRVIWLEHGLIRLDGDPNLVLEAYLEHIGQKREQKIIDDTLARARKRLLNSNFELEKVEFLDAGGRSQGSVQVREPLKIRSHYRAEQAFWDLEFQLSLRRADGTLVLSSSSRETGQDLGLIYGCGYVDASFDHFLFSKSLYIVGVKVVAPSSGVLANYETILHVEDYKYDDRGGMPAFFHPVAWRWVRSHE
jgi:lipopolysaccharide transport system ATP-binding protein